MGKSCGWGVRTIDGVDAMLERDALTVDRHQLAVQVRDCDSSASGQRNVTVVISYSLPSASLI